MRILIIVNSLTDGGAERVAASWANGLSKLGHEVTILTDLTGQTYPVDEKVTLEQHTHFIEPNTNKYLKQINKITRQFKYVRYYMNFFKSHDIDVLINVLYISTFALLIAKYLSRKKFLFIMTDHNSYERPPKYKLKLRERRMKFIDNRFADIVTVLTNPDKDILLKHGIKNVEVLHNPLFTTPVEEVAKKKQTILAVGRIDAWEYKGFDLLIKAWSKISNNYPDWNLKIVGKGDLDTIKWLKSLDSNKCSTVEFKPFTADIIEEYKKAAIFVLSSRYEGWGLVAVEAMSQGCATIACDYNGRQAEFIEDGVNGILCEPDNEIMLAERISFLIENESARTLLQQNAPKSVKIFNEDSISEKLEHIIIQHI